MYYIYSYVYEFKIVNSCQTLQVIQIYIFCDSRIYNVSAGNITSGCVQAHDWVRRDSNHSTPQNIDERIAQNGQRPQQGN